MNKTQYDILKYIKTESDRRLVGVLAVKEHFPNIGDPYYFLKWFNSKGYIEEVKRKSKGYKKDYCQISEDGDAALLEFEESDIISEDSIENLLHVVEKYGSFTINFLAGATLSSYSGASVVAVKAFNDGLLDVTIEGRIKTYSKGTGEVFYTEKDLHPARTIFRKEVENIYDEIKKSPGISNTDVSNILNLRTPKTKLRAMYLEAKGKIKILKENGRIFYNLLDESS